MMLPSSLNLQKLNMTYKHETLVLVDLGLAFFMTLTIGLGVPLPETNSTATEEYLKNYIIMSEYFYKLRFYYLVTDWLTKIRFSGTRNQPKNGVKAS